jgi:hypothetical protein
MQDIDQMFFSTKMDSKLDIMSGELQAYISLVITNKDNFATEIEAAYDETLKEMGW